MANKKKKNELELEYEKSMKKVKRIGIISCCFVFALALIGSLIIPNSSYALLSTTPLPDRFTSEIPKGQAGETKFNYIGTISTLKWFKAIHTGGSLSDVYCIEHRLGQEGNIHYTKGDSVLTRYPGLVYILENNNFGVNDAELNYHLSQITVWWYLDRVNGYQDDKNYIGPSEVWTGTETEETDKEDERGMYRFYNNLSVLDKIAVKENTQFGPKIIALLEGALAYRAPATPTLNVTNRESITFTVEDGYLVTSEIAATGNELMNYTVTPNEGSKVEVLDSTGAVKKTLFNANEKFKIRVPASEIKDNHVDLDVTIAGKFRRLNGYIYNPDDASMQRTVMGVAGEETLTDKLELDYDVELGKVIIHKQDQETGNQVVGATLVITDSLGKEVAKFVTEDKPKEYQLPIGKYTLTETIIPEGYTAEQNSYEFNVTKDTTIEVFAKNIKKVEVPDTKVDSSIIIYGIGISIVIIGVILIVVALRPEKKKSKKTTKKTSKKK